LLGAAGVDDALGEGKVGGEEEIEGGSVDDLGGEGGGGLIGGFGVDAGLVLEAGEELGQDGLEVGGCGYAEGLLGSCREGDGDEGENQRRG